MRVVGVAELRVQLPGQVEVGRVPTEAGHLLLAIGTDECGRRHGRSLRQARAGPALCRPKPVPFSLPSGRMKVAAVTVGAYDKAGLSIQGLRVAPRGTL